MKFLPYNPDQAYLLPPSVKDVLGENHLCFFLHQVVEELDLSGFEADYVEEGRAGYAPALLLKVWLYAYALQVTSSRRLEQRVKEDLAFRYLAGGSAPDHWTLNAFRTRHRRAINDLFLQVVEVVRGLGMARLVRYPGFGTIDKDEGDVKSTLPGWSCPEQLCRAKGLETEALCRASLESSWWRIFHQPSIRPSTSAMILLFGHPAGAGCESAYSEERSGLADHGTNQAPLDVKTSGYGL